MEYVIVNRNIVSFSFRHSHFVKKVATNGGFIYTDFLEEAETWADLLVLASILNKRYQDDAHHKVVVDISLNLVRSYSNVSQVWVLDFEVISLDQAIVEEVMRQ